MSEIKATEGPWRVTRRNPEWLNIESEHFHIAHVIGGISMPYSEDETLYANAHCMAASREMLEMLEWIADGSWNDGPGSWSVLDRRIEEVIAKAKGEA